MVVDDSAVIRGLITRWIEAEPDMVVVGSLRTGRDAVNQIGRIDPDVAVLDIEMPDLDGISALPILLAKKRNLVVIMASTLTRRNAEVSLKALSLGASDYIPKPESTREPGAAEIFRRDLVEKIRNLGARTRRTAVAVTSPPLAPSLEGGQDHVRRFTAAPDAAVKRLIAEIKPVIDRVPVLITQHMPPTFTTILAEHLARTCGRPVHEGIDGEPVVAGQVYLAPGGRHMRVARRDGKTVIVLDDGPPVNFCKPAVDPMFTSAVDIWQGAMLAVVLTGMGSDGMRGGKSIIAAGGSVIAQDEASSVVWGMPGAAAHAGICAAILPLGQIGSRVVRLFAGDRS